MVSNAKGFYLFILHSGGILGIGEAYLKKYWRFCNFGAPGGQFWINLGYSISYLATGDKLGTISDLGCKCKRCISIDTSLWYIFGHWGSIYLKIFTIL